LARVPVRPDPHPQPHGELPAGVRVPARAALPLRHRQSDHARRGLVLRLQPQSIRRRDGAGVFDPVGAVFAARSPFRQDVDVRSMAIVALPRRSERDQLGQSRGRDVQLRLQPERHGERAADPARPRRARGVLMRRARLSLLGLLAGCTASFDPPSFVAGLRVLAVKAEPPEVAPGETTTLTALDVDTDGRAIAISWSRCLVRPLPGSPVADDCVTGAQPDDLMSVGAGTPLAFTMPAATPGDLGPPDSTGG